MATLEINNSILQVNLLTTIVQKNNRVVDSNVSMTIDQSQFNFLFFAQLAQQGATVHAKILDKNGRGAEGNYLVSGVGAHGDIMLQIGNGLIEI